MFCVYFNHEPCIGLLTVTVTRIDLDCDGDNDVWSWSWAVATIMGVSLDLYHLCIWWRIMRLTTILWSCEGSTNSCTRIQNCGKWTRKHVCIAHVYGNCDNFETPSCEQLVLFGVSDLKHILLKEIPHNYVYSGHCQPRSGIWQHTDTSSNWLLRRKVKCINFGSIER